MASTVPTRRSTTRAGVRAVGAVLGAAAALTVLTALPAAADTPSACPTSSAHDSSCNYVRDQVLGFTQPGPSATGTFSLTLDTHEVRSGADSNGGNTRAPDATLTASSPGWQQVDSGGMMTGAITQVGYRAADAPFGPQDQVGYFSSIPFDGQNTFTASGSQYLFASMVTPTDLNTNHATTTTTFSDRPLSIAVHDGLPGVTLTKVGDETSGGLLLDPAATDQDVAGATVAPEDTTHSGNAYYGGYRSGSADAVFGAVYEVAPPPAGTDPTSPQALLAGTQIHLGVHVDVSDPTKQESTCTVSSPTSLNTVDCAVTQTGSNEGQSAVTFSITKP